MASFGRRDKFTQAAWETEQLFEKHSANLIRYLRSGVRIANDLEDIAQETFVRYFRARCSGESIDNPKGWLYRVGRHLAIDHVRKHRPALLDEDGWRRMEAKQATLPEWDSDQLTLRTANLPWDELSPKETECLLLRAEGMTFREVSEVMGVSISSAASYAARAIKKFRRAARKESSETPQHGRTAPLRSR